MDGACFQTLSPSGKKTMLIIIENSSTIVLRIQIRYMRSESGFSRDYYSARNPVFHFAKLSFTWLRDTCCGGKYKNKNKTRNFTFSLSIYTNKNRNNSHRRPDPEPAKRCRSNRIWIRKTDNMTIRTIVLGKINYRKKVRQKNKIQTWFKVQDFDRVQGLTVHIVAAQDITLSPCT